MRTCQGCGGVLGRDCWNEEDCMAIAHDQELVAQQWAKDGPEDVRHLWDAINRLNERVEQLEKKTTPATEAE